MSKDLIATLSMRSAQNIERGQRMFAMSRAVKYAALASVAALIIVAMPAPPPALTW